MKHLQTIGDLTPEYLSAVLALAEELQAEKSQNGFIRPLLRGKTVILAFEKPSLRTRASFEIATADLGGHPVFFGPDELFLSADGTDRETIEDIVHNLERFGDAIVARVYGHKTIERMAQISAVPVINALSDRHHPSQAICDIYALKQHFGTLQGLKVAFVGDGNNVATSLAQICSLAGAQFTIATREGYEIPGELTEGLQDFAQVTNPFEAVIDADAVVTDTWVSMGFEDTRLQRLEDFRRYQVTPELMRQAKKTAVFMHCLPAHRGEEVTPEVIDGPQSIVFDQAVSRLFIARALLVKMMTEGIRITAM